MIRSIATVKAASMSSSSALVSASHARAAELAANISAIHTRIAAAATAAGASSSPTLVAVSKLKPASDIAALHAATGHRDFGENFVQELATKAPSLSSDIRWHFIGHVQTNKAKALAAIPNLYAVHTVTSTKLATALNNARDASLAPLDVLLQVNTSGEEAKSGLAPLVDAGTAATAELTALARHVLRECPRLRLAGLMTIGAKENSLEEGERENADFATLRETRRLLREALGREGEGVPLELSMGMSADFEGAIRAGSSMVRVGSSIFGERPERKRAG